MRKPTPSSPCPKRESKTQMQSRLGFERLLSEMSARFLKTKDYDDAILQSLGELGRFCGAGRTYLFLFDPDPATCSNTHEWCSEGILSQKASLQGVSVAQLPWFMERLREDGMVVIPDTSIIPETGGEREHFLRQGIRSLVASSVHVDSSLAGFTGMDNVEQALEWQDADVLNIALFGDRIGCALLKKQMEGHLKSVNRDLEEMVEERTSKLQTAILALRDDIVRREVLEEELRVAKERAEEASRAKSAFLANMSHEIRTPLNAIMGMTDLLLESPLPEGQRERMEAVRNASRFLMGLLGDILDYSDMGAVEPGMRRAPFDIRDLCRQVGAIFRQEASRKGLAFSFREEKMSPIRVLGDGTRLAQVLMNLLGNAVKFAGKGAVSLVLEEQALPGDEGRTRVRFSVEDTGPGIPEGSLESIFEEFGQLDLSYAKPTRGMGLGLPISRKIVEAMGGTLDVESRFGKGSAFSFTLDFDRATAPVIRILAAEDDPINGKVLSVLASGRGWSLDVAATCGRALSLLRSDSWDLVLVNGEMQGAEEIFAFLEGNGESSPPAVSMIRGGERSDACPGIRGRFPKRTLLKPFRPGEFFKAVDEALGKGFQHF